MPALYVGTKKLRMRGLEDVKIYPFELKCTGNQLNENNVILQLAIFVLLMCRCLIRNWLIWIEDSSVECRREYCTLSDKFELANKHIQSSKHKFDMQIDSSLRDGR